jgi:hypothetical protein
MAWNLNFWKVCRWNRHDGDDDQLVLSAIEVIPKVLNQRIAELICHHASCSRRKNGHNETPIAKFLNDEDHLTDDRGRKLLSSYFTMFLAL